MLTFVRCTDSLKQPVDYKELASLFEVYVSRKEVGGVIQSDEVYRKRLYKFATNWVAKMRGAGALRSVKPGILDGGRANLPELEARFREFADTWQCIIKSQDGNIPDKCMINIDEMLLHTTDNELRFSVRVVDSENERPNVSAPGVRSLLHGSAVIATAPDGPLCAVICLKMPLTQDDLVAINFDLPASEAALHEKRGKLPIFYCASTTGFISGDHFFSVMLRIIDLWKERHGQTADGKCQLRPYFFLDNLLAHKRADMACWVVQQGGEIIWLVPNASHSLNANDWYINADVKVRINNQMLQHLTDCSALRIAPSNSAIVFFAVEALCALSDKSCRASWKKTLLPPSVFDRDKFVAYHTSIVGGNRLYDKATDDIARGAQQLMEQRLDNAAKRLSDDKSPFSASRKSISLQLPGTHVLTGSEMVLRMVNPNVTTQLAAVNKEIVALQSARLKDAKQCRSIGCCSKSRGGKTWLVCECDVFLLCPAHKKSDVQRLFKHMLLECKNADTFIRISDKASATDCGVCAKPAAAQHVACGGEACTRRFHAKCLPPIARSVGQFACSAACGSKLLAVDDEAVLAQRLDEQVVAATALAAVVSPYKNKLKRSSSIRKDIRRSVRACQRRAGAEEAQKQARQEEQGATDRQGERPHVAIERCDVQCVIF
jgi:hypothetical protein